MDTVFLLWYLREWDDENDTELLIGVYASEADAEAAIERLKGQPGFVRFVEGFQIHPYKVGQDNWIEGYARMAGEVNLVA